MLLHECRGGQAIPDQAAGQPLHGDKAHIRRPAFLHQFQFLGPGQVAEGELKRIIQPGADGLVGHRQAVVSDGDVADLSLALGLQGGVIQAVRSPRTGTEGGVVELIDVDMVSAQGTQAALQVLPEPVRRLGGGFCRQDHPVPHPGKGCAHLLLAV